MNTEIDLMVVYSVAARQQAGGTAAIETRITNEVNRANTSFTDSNVEIELNLVHLAEVANPGGSSLSDDVDRLIQRIDAALPALNRLN